MFYRRSLFDSLMNFDLYEEQTPQGSWVCTLRRDCPDPDNPDPLIEYANREELWIKHSFEPLAAWTRTAFAPNACLCFSRSEGAAWAADKLGLVELINHLVPSQMDLSPGHYFLAMVLDTLSGRNPLYRLEHFFEEQDMKLLLGMVD